MACPVGRMSWTGKEKPLGGLASEGFFPLLSTAPLRVLVTRWRTACRASWNVARSMYVDYRRMGLPQALRNLVLFVGHGPADEGPGRVVDGLAVLGILGQFPFLVGVHVAVGRGLQPVEIHEELGPVQG